MTDEKLLYSWLNEWLAGWVEVRGGGGMPPRCDLTRVKLMKCEAREGFNNLYDWE